jgi:acyl-CoA synthetase (AMP-forming)/AMP-acid ligase II
MYSIKKEFYGCLVNIGAVDVLLNDETTQEQLKLVHESASYDDYTVFKAEKPASVIPEKEAK